jgi:hypothetical protein
MDQPPINVSKRRRGVIFSEVVEEIYYETSPDFSDDETAVMEQVTTSSVGPLHYDFGDDFLGFNDLADFARLSSSSSSDGSEGSSGSLPQPQQQLPPSPPLLSIEEYDASASSFDDEDSEPFHKRERLDEYDGDSALSFFDKQQADRYATSSGWFRRGLSFLLSSGGVVRGLSRCVLPNRDFGEEDGLAFVAAANGGNGATSSAAAVIP